MNQPFDAIQDRQLQDYIAQSSQAGKTDEQIRQELLNAGWPEDVINQHMERENPQLRRWSSVADYYIEPLKKYAVFSGRASRAEYWYFVLFNFVIGFALGLVEGWFGIAPESDDSIFANIYSLAVLIPSLAVGVRRMHDVDKSGWYILIPIYDLILALRDGTEGDNKYGSNPKRME